MIAQLISKVFKRECSSDVDVEAGQNPGPDQPKTRLSQPLFQRVIVIRVPSWYQKRKIPLLIIRLLLNLLSLMVLVFLAIVALRMYFEVLTLSFCPAHVDLDLQLACVPETLSYQDLPVSNTGLMLNGSQCQAPPVQTLPQLRPCSYKIFKGDQNVTCYVQNVMYLKWTVSETFVATAYPIRFFNEPHIVVTEMHRLYSYSCKGPVNEELPMTSYKEPLELIERIRTTRASVVHHVISH